MGSETADSDLVARLRRHQEGAFDELFRRHRDRVWRFVRQLCGRTDVAEDVFQETWLAAARHVHKLHEDTGFLPWLLTIARNKYRNAMRAMVFDERRREKVSAEPLHPMPAPDAQTDVRRRAARVAAALATLPEAYREILLLTAVDGLDSASIGVILELKPEAVRKRLSRARAELLRLTGPLDPDQERSP